MDHHFYLTVGLDHDTIKLVREIIAGIDGELSQSDRDRLDGVLNRAAGVTIAEENLAAKTP